MNVKCKRAIRGAPHLLLQYVSKGNVSAVKAGVGCTAAAARARTAAPHTVVACRTAASATRAGVGSGAVYRRAADAAAG